MNPIAPIGAEKFSVGGGFRVEVYRRDDRFGTGGCMSFFCDEVEVMRFDLFAPAHVHFAVKQGDAPRVLFVSGTIEQHRERAMWDLFHNARPAILMCSDERVFNRSPDWAAFEARLSDIRDALEAATTPVK